MPNVSSKASSNSKASSESAPRSSPEAGVVGEACCIDAEMLGNEAPYLISGRRWSHSQAGPVQHGALDDWLIRLTTHGVPDGVYLTET